MQRHQGREDSLQAILRWATLPTLLGAPFARGGRAAARGAIFASLVLVHVPVEAYGSPV